MKIYHKFDRSDTLETRIELSLNENFKNSLTNILGQEDDLESMLYTINRLFINSENSNEKMYRVKLFFGEGYSREVQFSSFISTLWYIFTFKLKFFQNKILDFIGGIYNWLSWKKFCLKHNISKDRYKALKKNHREFTEELIRWDNK